MGRGQEWAENERLKLIKLGRYCFVVTRNEFVCLVFITESGLFIFIKVHFSAFFKRIFVDEILTISSLMVRIASAYL